MKHNKNWYVECTKCKREIEYGYPFFMDDNKNIFCDEKCLCLHYGVGLFHLSDELNLPDDMWHKFDD